MTILLIILFFYLALNSFYIFVFAMAGRFSRSRIPESSPKDLRFALLFPAYKGDAVILNSVRESFGQQYDKELYRIVVIADQLQAGTISELRNLGAQVVEVTFESSTKAKSLNAALEVLEEDAFDYAVILDIDNIMHPDFLMELNNGLADTPLIAQGHRVAKNMDTDFAILDALSEEINNTIFRKGHVALGLSSALIGSGIAMRYKEFKAIMNQIKAVGGFDKEMEVRLLRDGKYIHYLEHAIVYDEKVQEAGIFENQRKRWLSAQFHYLRLYFFDCLKHLLLRGNLDYFNKVLQFALLPRVLLLGLSIVFALLSMVFPAQFYGSGNWLLLPILIVVSLVLATPSSLRNGRTILALRRIPLSAWIMFRTLFRLKGANKKFIHTPHSEKK